VTGDIPASVLAAAEEAIRDELQSSREVEPDRLARAALDAAAPLLAGRDDPALPRPEDLTDEALAAANRLHDIVHPARQGGVYDPERNAGGCDKMFCCRILIEVPAVIEPAIREDERRRIGGAR
jgi:hypothetical protein